MPLATGILEIPFDKAPQSRHGRIIEAIRRRWRFSRDRMSDRYVAWSDMEDEYAVYMPTKEADAERKANRKSSGEPEYTTIVVPYSYAQLLSAHTYWTSVFLSRSPIFQFVGRHGETENSSHALEAQIDYQVQVGGMLVPLYIWLLDPGKYGHGIIGVYWDEEEAAITEIIDQPIEIMGIQIPGATKKVRQTRMVAGYEGNKLYNVRPYDFFPDPRVPVGQFQQGEFVGRYLEVGWNHVKKKEASGNYYNIDQLKLTKPTYWMKEAGSPRNETPTSYHNASMGNYTSDQSDPLHRMEYIELLEMHVELVPKDWELGTSEYPEKWVFTVGNDEVILSAQPLGFYHNKFPFHVIEYEAEGYSLFKRGMLEMLKPMNDVLTWLFNSHFYNVRKILNDNLVYDPSKIVGRDLERKSPGRMIRLRPSAYGTDPKMAVHQLSVTDVTAQHMRDSVFVMDLMQRMVGVTDQLMGMMLQGGRRSATEARQSAGFGMNRLKTNAEYFSAQGFAPLAQMLVQNTQQRYDQVKQFRVAGKLLEMGNPYMMVSPQDISGFYDFLPVDGTLPIDRVALASLWQQLMGGMAQIPDVLMQYDMGKIFGYVAHLAGIKNLNEFKIDIQPMERIQQLQQMGNLVKGGGNSGRQQPGGGRPAGGAAGPPSEGAGRGTATPRQLAGVGAI